MRLAGAVLTMGGLMVMAWRRWVLVAGFGALAAWIPVLAWGQSAEEPKGSSAQAEQTERPSEPEPSGAGSAAQGDAEGPAGGADQKPVKPSSQDVLRVFRSDRPNNQVIQPEEPLLPSSSVEAPPSAGLLRDGAYVNNRVGRLVLEDEWWVLHSEADSAENPEPPIRLLPNQQLERMVRQTQASSDTVLFVVSGEVTLFESMNYLLVRKALRRRIAGNLEK